MGNDFSPSSPKTQYTYKITSKAPELLSSLPLQDIFTVTDSAQYPGLLTVSEQISVWWILTSIEIDRVTFLSPRRYKMNSRTTKLPCHLPNLAGEYWNPYLASSERSFLSVPLDLSNNLTSGSAFTEGGMPAPLYQLCLCLSVASGKEIPFYTIDNTKIQKKQSTIIAWQQNAWLRKKYRVWVHGTKLIKIGIQKWVLVTFKCRKMLLI